MYCLILPFKQLYIIINCIESPTLPYLQLNKFDNFICRFKRWFNDDLTPEPLDMLLRRCISTTGVLHKMPAPKKRKDGPKQKKAPPKAPKLTMLEIRNRYMEETPPLPYFAYPDERCFLEQYKRPLAYVSNTEMEERIELEKEYTRFMNQYWRDVKKNHQKQVELRQRALKHLQEVDTGLYSAGIAFNFDVFPGTTDGLRETIPNPQHTAPLKVSEKPLENEEAVGTNAWLSESKEQKNNAFKRLKKKKSDISSDDIGQSVRL